MSHLLKKLVFTLKKTHVHINFRLKSVTAYCLGSEVSLTLIKCSRLPEAAFFGHFLNTLEC